MKAGGQKFRAVKPPGFHATAREPKRAHLRIEGKNREILGGPGGKNLKKGRIEKKNTQFKNKRQNC